MEVVAGKLRAGLKDGRVWRLGGGCGEQNQRRIYDKKIMRTRRSWRNAQKLAIAGVCVFGGKIRRIWG